MPNSLIPKTKQLLRPAVYFVLSQLPPPTRRFHAFCVGTPKSGTTSVANIFRTHFRAAHEPRSKQTADYLLDHLNGSVSRKNFRRYLRARDQRMALEMESAHALHHCIDDLVEEFEEACFVLTIRYPLEWINSEINQNYKVDPNSYWGDLQKQRYVHPPYIFTKHDRKLKEYDLHPVSKYFEYWASHNSKVLGVVPSEKLLIIRTAEIEDRLHDLADFLDISEDLLDNRHSHSYKRRNKKLNIFKLVDPDFVRSMMLQHCQPLLDQLFPE